MPVCRFFDENGTVVLKAPEPLVGMMQLTTDLNEALEEFPAEISENLRTFIGTTVTDGEAFLVTVAE